ncbi:MAG: RNA polymerase sigma factor [Planctomycetes bacterium]|nr:RNA polymerase sigma factor [Planctomycetota bacterium]
MASELDPPAHAPADLTPRDVAAPAEAAPEIANNAASAEDAMASGVTATATDTVPEDQRALLEAMQRGDRAAFAQIVERYQMLVFGYLRARLLQSNDAEDLTQEVFLRCFMARERFSVSHDIRPWLIGIARNLLREHVRRVRQRKESGWTQLCLELDTLAEVEADEPEAGLDHLPGCLDGLGDSARQAIEMRYCSQLRLSEIGDKLRRSEGAAKLLMFRARQALKNCLDRKFKAEDDD